MGRVELVRVGDVEFLVEVAEGGGPRTVAAGEAWSFDAVRDTVTAITSKVAEAWEQVKPDEASVEFGLKLSTKTGKLTGLLAEGGGEASLKITVTWKRTV